MTDKSSLQEEPEESEPHMKFEDGRLWERDGSGKWIDVTPPPKFTGDPQLDALWAMTASDVERIAEDESDPLHEKAKQVQYEAAEPFRRLAADLAQPWAQTFRPSLWKGATEALWNARPASPNIWLPIPFDGRSSLTDKCELEVEEDSVEKDDAAEESEPDVVSEDLSEVDEPSMTQMVVVWKEMLDEMRKSNGHWKKSIEDARKSAQEANDRARGSRRRSFIALIVSAVAAAAAVAGLWN